ncbi:MAG: hypothetical protein JXR81_09575 [Candidatus Goldbacteria bacterium]|nr:hypothetical protein [Candidatus Goldiibacteriota bacterium]
MAKKPAKKAVKKSIKKPVKKTDRKSAGKKVLVKKTAGLENIITPKQQPLREIKLISVVKNSFDTMVNNFWELMLLLFLPSACFLIGYLPSYRPDAQITGVEGFNWPFMIAGYLIGIITYIMVFVVLDRRDKGLREKSTGEYVKENLMGAVKRLPAVLLIGLIFFSVIAAVLGIPAGIIVFAALADESVKAASIAAAVLLFVIALGAVFIIVLVYGQSFILAVTRPGIKNPIAHSAKITKGKRWNILLLYILLWMMTASVQIMVMMPAYILGALSLAFIPLLMLVGIIYMVFIMAINVFNNVFYFSLFRALEDSYRDKNGTTAPGK